MPRDTPHSEKRKAKSQKRNFHRRRFLTGAGAVSATVLASTRTELAGRAAAAPQAQTDYLLESVADVILAPQGELPSVAEAEVARFARDRFAAGGHAEQLELALAGVEMETEALFGQGRGFVDLEAEERLRVVETIRLAETTTPAWMAVGLAPDEFYRQLRFHLVDGYYSHPKVHEVIGFAGAVQFVGHPDFTEFPKPDGHHE